ncbi:gas vesicle protein GvpL [Bacillus megaterium]|uniref:GvpL/GvpF family gas vesicle protein n=1 Tax=Priestia megaterium TaxID=1404 RepID=UPI0012931C91|nr:GvpL/GvpF family gas vesicle protein [Priestia megaterium]MQR89344.1 gas vesicle protein GvpL [Priestia megaterium]
MGELLYLYGLIPTKEAAAIESFPSYKGFDGEHSLYPLMIDQVTAVVSKLDADTYSEEVIKEKMEQDMSWLQEKAFHHHETVAALYEEFTIIPLKFCTIYKSEESLQAAIELNKEKIENSLKLLQGNEEWNVKIYCDDTELKKGISETNESVKAKKEEISHLSPGRQFFEKKKIDQLIEKELELHKNTVCEEIHDKLKELSLYDSVKKNWSKDVTGAAEQMAWNSVFLLPSLQINEFVNKIEELQQKLENKGWKFEVTGPWPPYHFSSFA